MLSLAKDHDETLARATELAGALLERPVVSVSPVSAGGNNPVWKVDCEGRESFALKSYPATEGDSRDRLAAEWGALAFLSAQGEPAAPEAVAVDFDNRVAAYRWIAGDPISEPSDNDLDSALAFVERLVDYAAAPEARALPQASEACLSGREVVEQVMARLRRLSEVRDQIDLHAFLEMEFRPALMRLTQKAEQGYASAGIDFAADLAPEHRILSPSDFGFHNALRRVAGPIAFIDFEYFGWDDPAKLACDFLLHPGFVLGERQRTAFAARADRIFAADPWFSVRVRLLYPLYGLRWCMIILNEFLPERWARRAMAGADDADAARARQLEKARAMLMTLGRYPHDA